MFGGKAAALRKVVAVLGSVLLAAALVVSAPVRLGAASLDAGGGQQGTRQDSAVDQNGNAHRWSPDVGAVTIIDFAASWCAPCRESLPRLEAFAASHPEVRVLVISVDDQVTGRDALVDELGLKVPVLWDENHRAAEHYRPDGMPATFVFDRDGREILAVVGSKEHDWRRVVEVAEGAL